MTTQKTESTTNTAPKTEPTNPFAAFDPMGTWAHAQRTMHELFADAFGRARAFNEEYIAVEQQMLARTYSAIDSWAQLARDTVAYGAQLSAQARKVSFDAAKKMAA